MLHVPVGANTFCLSTPSWGTTRPAAANGTAVTPGTGVYGSWASVITAVAQDVYGLLININSNAGSAASRNTLTKIGVDMAGGTSYVDLIPDLLSGGAAPYNVNGGGLWYYFPLFLPAGSRIAAAGFGTVTTVYRVGIVPMMLPANPALIRKGSFVEAVGVSGTTGTVFVPGTASEGAWTLLGTTTLRTWWWQVGVQVSSADTSWLANAIHIDVAVGDATNKDIIIQDTNITTSTAEQSVNPPLTAGVEWDTPAGSNIYVRGQASGNLDSYAAVAYGMGG